MYILIYNNIHLQSADYVTSDVDWPLVRYVVSKYLMLYLCDSSAGLVFIHLSKAEV